MHVRLVSLGIIVWLGFTGCTNFREVHYFKQSYNQGDVSGANYYRLIVSGSTSLSSARYLSGYFDEKAVNSYFSEFSQPENGSFTPSGQTEESGGSSAPQSGRITPIAGSHQGRSLVMILSTNSDAVADGINALANNNAILDSVARLAKKDDYQRVAIVRDTLEDKKLEHEGLVNLVKENLLSVKHAPQPDEGALQAAAHALLLNLGVSRTFQSLDEIDEWVGENRSLLLKP